MRPVRVAHVLWRLSPTGGIPRVVRDLCVGLNPAEVEIHVVSVRPAYPEDQLDEVIDAQRFHSAELPLGSSKLALAPAIVRLTRALRAIRPDVIHLHSGTSWLGLPAALSLPGAHRILEVHDEPQSGRSRRANVAAMRFSVRRLGFRLLVHSTVVRARTAEAFDIPEAEVDLIPLGVDTTLFRPDPVLRQRSRERLGLSDDQPLVAWVGRLEPLKRPEDALEVARAVRKTMPEAIFAMAGSGSLERSLAASVADDDAIRVLGQVEDLPAFLNAADVLLSTSGYEGFGLSVAEAMACGLPVVSTRAGGVVDLVTDGRTGALREIGDVRGLSSEVLHLLHGHADRASTGAAGRADVEARFSRPAMALAYSSIYRARASELGPHNSHSSP